MAFNLSGEAVVPLYSGGGVAATLTAQRGGPEDTITAPSLSFATTQPSPYVLQETRRNLLSSESQID
ncbi:hypothetical protein E2C01_090585 [Portunus trituberculatus]|uniref:Uncharacterized protein n=1 Tax=Portunus trituberculatus TaxID=210409 RepID=A0A5B7JQH9_PORTR|nr:hypothetical protein [Portunus trituberculatus]